MPIRRQPVVSLRNAFALFIPLAAIVLFATVALASVPPKLPAQAGPSGGATPSPTPTGCIQVWNVVESPNPNPPSPNNSNTLFGVAAVSSSDVWAVGTGMIQHWDGSVWTALTSTISLTPTTQLLAVSATSANDVWAVGRGDGAGHYTGVILHWDGSSWSNIPHPDPQDETGLFGVTAIAPNDAWAVGYQGGFNQSNAIAMHWDGSTWSIVTTPAPPAGDTYHLTAVSAIVTNDVWAVGWSNSAALVMHWDGSAWSLSPISVPIALFGVVAIAPDDVWASGIYWGGNTSSGGVVHWDGTSWSLATSADGTALYGMAATSSNDVWAVGHETSGTLVMHWDGTAWSLVNSPRPFQYAGELWSVSAISPTEVWATGDATASLQDISLTTRYAQWCPTPVQCQTGWNVIDVSNPGPDTDFINGIDGVSSNDIWAVGAFVLPNGGTYFQHWNGSYWLPVSIPDVPAVTDFHSVKALSATNVWAVGLTVENTRGGQDHSPLLVGGHDHNRTPESPNYAFDTITMHWDGTSWTRIPSPNPGTLNEGNELFSIAGVSSSDLWAVGYYDDNNGYETLTLHWNGSTWSQVASPAGELTGVAAIASNDVWAVGENSANTATLILHWDGILWSTVASPNPGTSENELQGVSAVSSDDIWAVGSYRDSGGFHALTLHWNGSQWSSVSVPGAAELKAVSSRASNDVWAVGVSEDSNQAPILHWDGTAWTIVSHPPPGPNPDDISELYGVLALSSNEVWAVGDMGHNYPQARVERYVGSCATPSPTVTQVPSATPTATCTTGWSVIDSPNPALTQDNTLVKVRALSATDAWAVGRTISTTQSLIEHWDGSNWSLVPTPDAGSLFSLAAISPGDAWAGGTNFLHWNGSQWSVVPAPNTGGAIRDIKAVASDDVWAVSGANVLHWNGTQWSIVSTPNSDGTLYGLLVFTSNDIWAVGNTTAMTTLTMHWNGSQWTIISSPNPGTTNQLFAIDGASANDIWAVGQSESGNTSLMLHWNGTSWTNLTGSTATELDDIVALSADDVWVAGTSAAVHALTIHWDGTSWTVVPAVSPANATQVFGVANAYGGKLWVVGYYRPDQHNRTLVEIYTPDCATATTDPTPSSTPSHMPSATVTHTSTPAITGTRTVTPTGIPTFIETNTPTPASTGTSVATATTATGATSTPISSATATPTTCTLQFEDVPAGSTFYAGVRCLACQGIINGYPCGGAGEPCNASDDPYFRPNNSVTRGQLAKIVSLAAGFFDPVSGQTFEDVLPASTFYTYVERLADRNVMSGYPCGGPHEPCDSQHRPYFRPNNTATRGQLTKIVSNAAGFDNIVPNGQQTFADVPAGSTYYLFVERLLMNRPGVMSGYPCGGPHEPCDSRHRPYFRPNNTVTRGQTAKITSNTFLPDCTP